MNRYLKTVATVICVLACLTLGRIPAFAQFRAFKIDSLFPSNVSDTLNVEIYDKSDWIVNRNGVLGLNELNNVQNYHPLFKDQQVGADLGNIGSAEHLVRFDFYRPFGFRLRDGRNSFWRLFRNELLISDGMYSNVQYSNGVNRENFLDINFTRGFGKLLDMGFNFRRIVSQGFYQRQVNTITDFSVYGAFKSADNRYRAVVDFTYANLRNQENGGLLNDSTFELNLNASREFMDVSLTQSENHWKGFRFGLDHRFGLHKNDTTLWSRKFTPFVSHTFSGSRHSMVHRNENAGELSFYQNIFFDSTGTYDSTNLLAISNVIRLELIKTDSSGIQLLRRLAVGAGHSYYRVSYDSAFSDEINNIHLVANVEGAIFRNFDWRANGHIMLFGYNIGDLKIDGGVNYSIGESRFDAFVDYNLYQPDYIMDNYSSNHFVWDNDWNQTQHLKTGLVYEQRRLRFRGEIAYHLIDNLVLYGLDRLPFQSTGVNQLLTLRLQEHFRLKWFHFVMDGSVQWNMTGDDIRVPLALGRGRLYYQNDLFKKKLRLQVGVQTSYLTSYFANAYNPAVSGFHLQDGKQIGDTPFMDVFLNLRVKKLRMFVKFTHINAGWLGYNYYHVPGYPVNDFAWHFGINWAFLD